MTSTGSNPVRLHFLVQTDQQQDFLQACWALLHSFWAPGMEFIQPGVPELPTQGSRRTAVNIWRQPQSASVPKPLVTDAPANASLSCSGSSVRRSEEGEHSQLKILLRNFST